jgi:hypothetical protein
MRIVFIADYFADELIGGAELSLQSRIDTCPFDYIKINSRHLDLSKLDKENDLLIFGNFAELSVDNLHDVQGNIFNPKWRYVVEECDYKYCVVRSSHKHKAVFGVDCDCHKRTQGKRIHNFFKRADLLFWKSEGQRAEYCRLFPGLESIPGDIMGGVFTKNNLDYILSLKNSPRDNKYFILKTDSWIKGYEDAVKYCHDNQLPYRAIGDMDYYKTLKELAHCKGIVYMPRGFDPSCRMITEAKLLGLDIRTTDLVQHMTESWFKSNETGMIEFLGSRTKVFWGMVSEYTLEPA